MSKFNRQGTRATATGPVTTTGQTTTYEGGKAWVRDARSELVLLSVVNMVGESTFYESAGDRDSRFTTLCQQAAVEDGPWFLAFVRWLRNEANMRSAALVASADGVHARLKYAEAVADAVESGKGVNRSTVDAALARADEPSEFLAYWHTRYGRNLPMPVKRGLADAARRLYSEYSLLKYDTASHAVRFADVLDLAHVSPDPAKPWQGSLFEYALHRRHGYADQVPDGLRVIAANRALRANPDHGAWLNPDVVREAGMTWEDSLSALGSKVDKAKLWESLIPSMGIFALVRNLRNFDEAGVSDRFAQIVINKLTDPETIAKSRMFPYRFLSAYREAPSLRWGHALETALTLSTANVPLFPGRTLVMVDTSASMRNPVSANSKIRHIDVGALIGCVIAHRSTGKVDLVGYANGMFDHPVARGGAVLKTITDFDRRVGEVGHGTETSQCLRNRFNGHDRVVVVTDGQAFSDGWGSWRTSRTSVSESIPPDVPLFGIDTSGYSKSSIDTSKPNRYEVGGFSDKLFTMMALLDSGHNARWPWER